MRVMVNSDEEWGRRGRYAERAFVLTEIYANAEKDLTREGYGLTVNSDGEWRWEAVNGWIWLDKGSSTE